MNLRWTFHVEINKRDWLGIIIQKFILYTRLKLIPGWSFVDIVVVVPSISLSILAITWYCLYVIGICFYKSLYIVRCLFKCCIVYSLSCRNILFSGIGIGFTNFCTSYFKVSKRIGFQLFYQCLAKLSFLFYFWILS